MKFRAECDHMKSRGVAQGLAGAAPGTAEPEQTGNAEQNGNKRGTKREPGSRTEQTVNEPGTRQVKSCAVTPP